ncbi:MAG TPA: 2-polyprenyl-3-methyl-6-methoxy-1,4-benzoquinone monooxygenase [Gammaproteobacteria bacterium]|nr:2-polyprenyl-3-methyl-6-methoxy-1,4-benzoquinone monooxygenase [Gammaproteobacteria bacterium]
MNARTLTPLDRLLAGLDQMLRKAFAPATAADSARPYPAAGKASDTLDDAQRTLAGRLMRVNHAGEVAAQALYHGQALTGRNDAVRDVMATAAREEGDHLAWCRTRLNELGSTASRLDPFWYLGSFAIGAGAGLLGDRFSLGFVAETERQVVAHLEGHLQRLPENDARSRAVIEQMRQDESRHGEHARRAGGGDLPAPVPELMRLASRVMTDTAYWI